VSQRHLRRPTAFDDVGTGFLRAAREGRDVDAYFNNDPGAAAVRNARTLKQLLGPSDRRTPSVRTSGRRRRSRAHGE
jgi:uncharacterized protein YecE (DUF72 family)